MLMSLFWSSGRNHAVAFLRAPTDFPWHYLALKKIQESPGESCAGRSSVLSTHVQKGG